MITEYEGDDGYKRQSTGRPDLRTMTLVEIITYVKKQEKTLLSLMEMFNSSSLPRNKKEITDEVILLTLKEKKYDITTYLLSIKPKPIKKPNFWWRFKWTNRLMNPALHAFAYDNHEYYQIAMLLPGAIDNLDLSFERVSFLMGEQQALCLFESVGELS
mgnify:CR=1 FL=1